MIRRQVVAVGLYLEDASVDWVARRVDRVLAGVFAVLVSCRRLLNYHWLILVRALRVAVLQLHPVWLELHLLGVVEGHFSNFGCVLAREALAVVDGEPALKFTEYRVGPNFGVLRSFGNLQVTRPSVVLKSARLLRKIGEYFLAHDVVVVSYRKLVVGFY